MSRPSWAQKRNATPRHEQDFYQTTRDCVEALMAAEQITGPVWEPACGDGRISEVLEHLYGLPVVSTDLVDRGYGEGGRDFLTEPELLAPVIVTNPPYVGDMPELFAQQALMLGAKRVCLLMRLPWLAGEARGAGMFKDHPPDRVWVLSFRPTLWHGDDPMARDSGGAISYAWYVWEAGSRPARPGMFLGGWLPRPPDRGTADAALLDNVWARRRLTRFLAAL